MFLILSICFSSDNHTKRRSLSHKLKVDGQKITLPQCWTWSKRTFCDLLIIREGKKSPHTDRKPSCTRNNRKIHTLSPSWVPSATEPKKTSLTLMDGILCCQTNRKTPPLWCQNNHAKSPLLNVSSHKLFCRVGNFLCVLLKKTFLIAEKFHLNSSLQNSCSSPHPPFLSKFPRPNVD